MRMPPADTYSIIIISKMCEAAHSQENRRMGKSLKKCVSYFSNFKVYALFIKGGKILINLYVLCFIPLKISKNYFFIVQADEYGNL